MKREYALLALAATTPVQAQTTDPFAGLPDVTFRYYTVSGADAAALRRSIDAARPTDPHGNEPVDAITHWTMRWRWTGRRHGRCDLAHARVTFSAAVTLPRLAEGTTLPPALAEDWARYIAALERHEANHVVYAAAQRVAVLTAIRGATCASADRAARTALAAIVAHDVAYDRTTRHGLSEGASFPGPCNLPADGQQSPCTPLPRPAKPPL